MLSFRVMLIFAFSLLALAATSHAVQCDDGSSCPPETTCCKIDDTRYGCCPVPHAVCCADHLHCCPHDTRCDTTRSQVCSLKVLSEYVTDIQCINKHGRRLPALLKFAANRPEVDNQLDASSETTSEERQSQETSFDLPLWRRRTQKVGMPLTSSRRECGNEGASCLSNAKCCTDAETGAAFCCGLDARGTCCRHGRTCCTEGFRCSPFGDECIRSTASVYVSMRMAGTQSALEPPTDQMTTRCDDGSFCEGAGATCCEVRAGLDDDERVVSFKCCGLENAICCSSHCCPRGYKCAADVGCRRAVSFF